MHHFPPRSNPWVHLPSTPHFVLKEDRELILQHNEASHAECSYNLNLHPEPFIGSLLAPIYLLALNPGLHDADFLFHSRVECLDLFRKAAIRSAEINSLYYFDQVFEGSPGADWWRSKTRDLTNIYGEKIVAGSLCCVQLYPYHSKKFSKLPGLTSTVLYTASVVQEAIDSGKTIIVMRSWRLWVSLVPDLSRYERIVRVRNPRNPSLSPANLGDNFHMFDRFLGA